MLSHKEEDNPFGSEKEFHESFMVMKAIVNEMYREWIKFREGISLKKEVKDE